MSQSTVAVKRLVLAVILGAFGAGGIRGQDAAPPARVLVVSLEDQIIQPVTARFLRRGLFQGGERDYQCVILRIDTPGGLMESARHVVKDILASQTPVVVYVAPSGARAGSAGMFIALAANVAAMAPGTNIGAGQPASVGGPLFFGKNAGEKQSDDAAAWARSLAELRGRNADWAVRTVREGISTPAQEALKEHVIDFLATDLDELLRELDDRKIVIGQEHVFLHTRGAIVDRLEMSWPERMLSLLANPTVAYLLLLVGFVGLMFEITHPGTWIPGVVGLTCLILAFFAMQMLPINYAGLALIVLGLLLVVLEVKMHSYGILTTVGIVCLLAGSAMLIEPVGGIERVSWLAVAPVSIAVALIVLVLVNNVIRAHKMKVKTGMEALIGTTARVKGDMNRRGYVYVAGELWQAHSDQPLQDGESVRIQGYEGLTLYVKP